MIRYLLDTNIVSSLMREPEGRVARIGRALVDAGIATSIVVAGELRFGVARRGSGKLLSRLDVVLSTLQVASVDPPFDVVYGDLRARLERLGVTLESNDLMIAAHAITLDCVLVSDDQAFARVPDLRLENWLRD